MKKFFLICAALAGALCLVFALAGCELFGSGSSAHTHTLTHVSAQAATCTAEGNEEYWYCSECGKYFTDEEAENETTLSALTVAASGHTDSDGDGSCDECGDDMDSEQTDPPATHTHTLTHTAAEAATCTAEGNLEYWYCSVCGKYFTDEAATKETTLSDLTVAAHHTLTYTAAVAATCTAEGMEEYWYCTVCEKYFSDEAATKETALEALTLSTVAHNYVNGVCTMCRAYAAASEGLIFTLSDDETYYSVTGIGECTDTDVVIPSEYEDLPVAVIGERAFYNNRNITSITIPDGVTSIGSLAFYWCLSLTSITIPDSVTSIDSRAFYNCTSLTSVTIGSGVIYIGSCAFYNCKELTEITIPENVTSIGSSAFYSCTGLTSITISDGVASIGSSTFYNCTSLTSITIPDSITSIGNDAFRGCSGLAEITLPFVGGSASATSASSSTLFGYIFGSSNYTGGTATTQYYASNSSTTYYIPTSLTTVTITGGEILYGAFYDCTGLESVTIGSGVTSIGNYAFYNCTSLTKIYYNATEYADLSSTNTFCQAGQSGEGITVYIGANVTSIPAYLFYPYDSNSYYLPKLVGVVFAEGSVCESIGNRAFEDCTGLTEIMIPNNVTSIGNSAFKYCKSLTEITIPNSVASIGSSAFAYCTSLTIITIPDNVTTIGDSAFYNCSNLTYNEYGNAYYLGNDSNLYVVLISATSTDITSVIIHKDTKVIYYKAFYGCTSLTSITIPDSVTSIGDSAFYRMCGFEFKQLCILLCRTKRRGNHGLYRSKCKKHSRFSVRSGY